MTVWVVSEASIGTLSQCTAVAAALGKPFLEKRVVPRRGLRRLFSKPLFNPSEPCPQLIVSCGSHSERHVLAMKAAYGSKPLAVHLQRPRMEGHDLVFVSRHDWRDEYETRPGYHKMLGVPHRFTIEDWHKRRAAARMRYAPNNERIVVVLIGGTNGAYAYDHATLSNMIASITHLGCAGWKVLATASRRTGKTTLDALNGLQSEHVVVWGNEGVNPYLDYLAAADAFLIAKDSVTMPCEALSTGKPVFSLDLSRIPGRRLDKFERFHEDLQETLGLTRPYRGDLSPYDYTPPDETKRIAQIVRQMSASSS